MISASSCTENRMLMHTHMERAIIEILDDNGRVVPYGEYGNVTVTGLDKYMMPLIRYQPGDIGLLRAPGNCSCVNKTPLLEIDSRSVDVFTFADGTKKSVKKFMKFFVRRPFFGAIQRIQVRQEKVDYVRILIEGVRWPLEQTQVDLLGKKIHESRFFPYGTKFLIENVKKIEVGGSKYKAFIPFDSNASNL